MVDGYLLLVFALGYALVAATAAAIVVASPAITKIYVAAALGGSFLGLVACVALFPSVQNLYLRVESAVGNVVGTQMVAGFRAVMVPAGLLLGFAITGACVGILVVLG